MARRLNFKTEKTDFSFAENYIEDRRVPRYVPVRAKFPLGDDRRAGNVDYTSELAHREFGRYKLSESVDYENLQVQPPKDYSLPRHQFVNTAPHSSNVPEGYYGTESGIYPIDFVPFTQGLPTDNPVTITELEDVATATGAEFLILDNTRASNTSENFVETPYYPLGDPKTGRFEWTISPEYQAPVSPEVRFPNGARKNRKFFR